MTENQDSFQAIEWADSRLHLLDQRRLPHEEVYLSYHDPVAVVDEAPGTDARVDRLASWTAALSADRKR